MSLLLLSYFFYAALSIATFCYHCRKLC